MSRLCFGLAMCGLAFACSPKAPAVPQAVKEEPAVKLERAAAPAAAEKALFDTGTLDSQPGLSHYLSPHSEACARGESEGCAALYRRSQWAYVGDELPMYGQTLKASCERGVADACGAHALVLFIERGDSNEAEEAVGLERRACEMGSDLACANHARLVAGGAYGLTADPQKAAILAQGRCERGGAESCVALAQLTAQGLGVDADEERSKALVEEACELGSASACFYLGQLAAEPDAGETKDEALAVARYTKACELEHGKACFNLAWAFLRGEGVAASKYRAQALAYKACVLGDRTACDQLLRTRHFRHAGERSGDLSEDEQARYPYDSLDDKLAAANHYCARGGADACGDYGSLILHVRGEDHWSDTIKYMSLGCRRGGIGACNHLGHLYRNASKACDASTRDPAACEVIGYMHLHGLKMHRLNGPTFGPDPAVAKQYLQRACDGGVQRACDAGASLP